MRTWIAAGAILAGGAVILHEMWAYVTRHVSQDPFVNARRLWRRMVGMASVVMACLLVCYFDEAAGWSQSVLWKLFIVASILLLALLALFLALRDAYKTARIALRETAALQAESINDLNRHLHEKARKNNKAGADPGK